MAPGFHFSWLLVSWLVVTTAKGQDVMTPPGSQNNVNPTDCQIITLTPPPTTRNQLTRAQPVTRTPTFYFPPRRPGFYPRFPNIPFFPPNNRRFQLWPFYPPRGAPIVLSDSEEEEMIILEPEKSPKKIRAQTSANQKAPSKSQGKRRKKKRTAN